MKVTAKATGLNGIINKLKKIDAKIKEAEEKTKPEAVMRIHKEIRLICWSAITDWYDSYSPHLYKRQEGLMNAYQVTDSADSVNVKLSPSLMTGSHHQSNSYVYEITMEQGFHGGPIWRTPAWIWSDPLGPAVKTSAPLPIIKQEIASSNFSKIVAEIFFKYFKL